VKRSKSLKSGDLDDLKNILNQDKAINYPQTVVEEEEHKEFSII